MKTWGYILIGFLMGIFLLQNTHVMTIKFLFWEMSMSRVIFVPFIFLLGFIAGFFTASGKTMGKKR
ncbi:MAG: LapA family protein [Candidatus Omnitrophica bacterium]|nr:LapA family protein [Candidatus Omnitrophota bacterium]